MEIPEESNFYGALHGIPYFRQALSSFLERRVCHRPIPVDRMAIAAGCGSMLDTLFYSLMVRTALSFLPRTRDGVPLELHPAFMEVRSCVARFPPPHLTGPRRCGPGTSPLLQWI